MSRFHILHTIFQIIQFLFSALKCYSVFSEHCSMILVPFFHFSEHLFSLTMFVYKTLLEKDIFKESSISTEFLHTQSVSSELHSTTSARTSTHVSTAASGRQFQMSVFCWEKAKVPPLMETVPLILIMKSKYTNLPPGQGKQLELSSATMPSESSKCWKSAL